MRAHTYTQARAHTHRIQNSHSCDWRKFKAQCFNFTQTCDCKYCDIYNFKGSNKHADLALLLRSQFVVRFTPTSLRDVF